MSLVCVPDGNPAEGELVTEAEPAIQEQLKLASRQHWLMQRDQLLDDLTLCSPG